ncbi:MAG: hypothetical protein MJ091_06370, partial [Clostridia bacterium]|nr:hypothetical protein [Clostridia bacterium]
MKLKKLICIICAAVMTVSFAACSDGGSDESSKYKNTSSDTSAPDNRPENPINFEALKKDCADVKGWITLENTVIDYPILQSSPDKQEGYYLSRDMS